MRVQPDVHVGLGAAHQREHRELIYDSIIERRRIKKDNERFAGRAQRIQLRERARCGLQYLRREHIGLLIAQTALKFLREKLMRLDVIDAPDNSVAIEKFRICRRKMQRDEW